MKRKDLPILAEKARDGDANAMNDLMGVCYNDLYYYAYATMKDEDQAADVTQDSCLEIINTIGNLREPAAFMTWAKRIVYHQCTRRFKQTVELQFDENEDGETVLDRLPDEDPGSLPEQIVEDKELQRLLQQMLSNLSAPQRSALMLYYFEHQSVGEIAHIQDTTEGTVKSRLNYGRKAMKDQVEAYEKKTGIRIHSIAPLPLLLYFLFAQEAVRASAAATGALAAIGKAISAAIGVGGAGAGAAVGASGVSAGLSLGAKIAIGITAAVIAVGGTVAATTLGGDQDEEYAANKRDCQAICQEFQGNWVKHLNEDRHEGAIRELSLTADGELYIDGESYYIFIGSREGITREYQDGSCEYFPCDSADFAPGKENLFDYDYFDDEEKRAKKNWFVLELYQPEDWCGGVYRIEVSRYDSEHGSWMVMGNYYPVSVAEDLPEDFDPYAFRNPQPPDEDMEPPDWTDPTIPEPDPIPLGVWESRTLRPEILEFQENGKASYAGEELIWEELPAVHWYERVYKLSTPDGKHRYTACLELGNQKYNCTLLDAYTWHCLSGDPNPLYTPYVDLFYRPADYTGYTKLAITPENVMQFLTTYHNYGINRDWDDSNPEELFLESKFSFRDGIGQASLCAGTFTFQVETLPVRLELATGKVSFGEVIHTEMDTSDSGNHGDMKYYTTRLQIDSQRGIHYLWDSRMIRNTENGIFEDQAVRYTLTGAVEVYGFALVPPDMAMSGEVPDHPMETAPYRGRYPEDLEGQQGCRDFAEKYQGAWLAEDGTILVLHTDGTLEYNGVTYYACSDSPVETHVGVAFQTFEGRVRFSDNPFCAYYPYSYGWDNSGNWLDCMVVSSEQWAEGEYKMVLEIDSIIPGNDHYSFFSPTDN